MGGTGSVKLLTLYDSFSRRLVIIFAPFSDWELSLQDNAANDGETFNYFVFI